MATDEEPHTSRWATGLVLFAGVVMMVAGVWHALAGLGALVNDKVYVSTPAYIYSFDLTGWGWIHILLGIVVAAAGFVVLMGMMWARVVGIVVASLSLIANFMFIPHYQGSGGRRELHPPAPTDPGVTVSCHRALVILVSRRS